MAAETARVGQGVLYPLSVPQEARAMRDPTCCAQRRGGLQSVAGTPTGLDCGLARCQDL
jgi:hypothetical protein